MYKSIILLFLLLCIFDYQVFGNWNKYSKDKNIELFLKAFLVEKYNPNTCYGIYHLKFKQPTSNVQDFMVDQFENENSFIKSRYSYLINEKGNNYKFDTFN